MNHFVSEIFVEPKRWGLRGDPFLWDYLKSFYSSVQIPYSTKSLKQDIYRIFKQFTGEFPTKGKNYFVKDFSKPNSGMSSGCLSSDFWLNDAIPLLIKRLEEWNNRIENAIE